MRTRILSLIIVLSMLGCTTQGQEPIDVIHVLFVGNSLTYTNDLPELVKNIAAKKGMVIEVSMLAKPNYAIVDHWAEGEVQGLINSKRFDYVVIQQGPSSQKEGRDMLIRDGKKYARLCKKNNAQLVYFMVWPAQYYYPTFDGVITNYTAAAEVNNAILCPVGKAWKAHFDATQDFSYYGPDGFHPSLQGSTVAAQVIVERLFVHTNTKN